MEVWQADAQGKYDVQYEDLAQPRARGVLQADAQGRFEFHTIVAEPYPIPTTALWAICCVPPVATLGGQRTCISW